MFSSCRNDISSDWARQAKKSSLAPRTPALTNSKNRHPVAGETIAQKIDVG
jgi:hypothetical protein